MKIALAISAAVLVIIGHVPYLRDMFRHKVQPHAYSWAVWTIVQA